MDKLSFSALTERELQVLQVYWDNRHHDLDHLIDKALRELAEKKVKAK